MTFRNLAILFAALFVFSAHAAENVKAFGPVSKANIKAVGAVAEVNIKAIGVVDNTGGGYVDPSSYSPYAWYRADVGVTNYSDAAAADADYIKNWQDQSGNGNHLLGPVTDTDSLRFQTGIQNGLPAAESGETRRMTRAITSQSQPYTVYMVLRNTSLGTLVVYYDSTNSAEGGVFAKNSASDQPYVYAGSVLTDEDGLSNPATYIFALVFDGASSSIWKNGTQVKTGDAGSLPIQGLVAGNNYNFTLGGSTLTCELILYAGAHDATKVGNVTGSLNTRWAVY